MAQSRERKTLAKVLVHEGGYVNHPVDPGGPTNQGVTQRVYEGYRKGKGLAPRSVKNITERKSTRSTTVSIGTL
jgi:lysozyme family protein